MRFAGQTRPGTSGHRHAAIRDQATEKDHVPLRTFRADVSLERAKKRRSA